MEGPGLMTNILREKRVGDLHPGTINFNARLEEAQRIHKDNMILAARLDKMQPYYKRENLTNVVKYPKKKKTFIPTLKLPKGGFSGNDKASLSERSTHDREKLKDYDGMQNSQSARKPDKKKENPVKVLLEYSKLQDGKILDVAVVKVQDNFFIYDSA